MLVLEPADVTEMIGYVYIRVGFNPKNSQPKNKANIANSLLDDWTVMCKQTLSPCHDIARAVRLGPGTRTAIPEFKADHKQADSLMFLHVAHAKQTGC